MSTSAPLLRRGAAACAAAALLAVSGFLGGTALADTADTSTPSCSGVLAPGASDNPSTKTLVSQSYDSASDTYTLVYSVQLNGPRASSDATYRLRDCGFYSDQPTDQYNDEPLVVNTDNKDATFTDGAAQFTVTLTGATEGSYFCDRAAVSGDDGTPTGFTDKSNFLCTQLTQTPPPDVPEVPVAALLPVAGVLALGAVLLVQRRRGSAQV